ncbi:MAG: LamG domain-containing protein [Kiritimatiellae bacterium]|jgi:hypothetical protein|nr:LamG domain-containing protein [Kiritimatiellia bacterium]
MNRNAIRKPSLFIHTLATVLLTAIFALQLNAAEILMHCPFDGSLDATHASGEKSGLARSEKYVTGQKGQAVHIGKESEEVVYLNSGNLDKARGSIEIWVRPDWKPGAKTQHALFWGSGPRDIGSNCIWLWGYGTSIRFDVRDPKDSYVTANINGWQPGEWHHIVATWNCKKGLALYIDGTLARQREATWTPRIHGSFHIGNRPNSKMPAQAAFDELFIYTEPLTADEVKLAYAGKLTRTPVAKQITTTKALAPRPPKLIFHLPLDGNANAVVAGGSALPKQEKKITYEPGLFGQAARFTRGSQLRFVEKGNLNKKRGTISLWFRPKFSGQETHNEKGNEIWRTLFREGPPPPKRVGSNESWLWFHGSRLRFDVADYMDNHLRTSVSQWKKDEWHHIVCTWDSQCGHALYLDGKLSAGGSDSKKLFLTTQWETKLFDWFQIGGDSSGHPTDGLIEDLRIFDGPLTKEQIQIEFGNIYPVSPTANQMYFAVNQRSKLRWQLNCKVPEPTQGTLQWWVEDSTGKHVMKTRKEFLKISKGASEQSYECPFTPTRAGYYTLTCRWEPSGSGVPYTRSLDIWGIDISRTPSGAEKMDLEQVTEIDCSKPLTPQQLVESAPTRIVKAPCGTYLEAGTERKDRFALRIPLPQVNCPYIVEWEYPDDKPRTMEMISQTVDAADSEYELQTGVFTGDEYPLSNQMQTHRCLYWPRNPDSALVFMTAEKDHPAAVSKLRVYRIRNGITRAAAPQKPAESQEGQRHIGIYYEDPALCYDFGNLNSMPGFETLADRLITYMHYSGQDLFMYPSVWYHGPMYPSKSQESTMARPHPKNFIGYLLLRFEAENIGYIPTINLHSLPSLAHFKWQSDMLFTGEAAKSALSVGWNGGPNLAGWHGTRPNYNIQHPEVRGAVLTMVDEMLELYGDSPAFKGICFHLTKHCILWHGNLDGGYNDYSIEAFQKETGLAIPVTNDDPMRVSKRFRWIMANAREDWIDWRCRSLRSFYGEVAEHLAAKRPDLRLVLTMYRPVFRDIVPTPGKVPANDFVRDINREGGLDPALFKDLPNVVLDRTIYPADYRWYRAHKNPADDPIAIRNLLTSPQGYQSASAGGNTWINMHDRYWEDAVGRTEPKWKSYWGREHGWRVSTLNPTDRYAMESYLIPLANADIMTFTKGGFLIGTHGMENHLAAFSRAFRSLPAKPFKDLEGVEALLTIRFLKEGKNFYVYAVNPSQQAAVLNLTLKGNIDKITDLTTGMPIKITKKLNTPMPPMSFNAYRIEGTKISVER